MNQKKIENNLETAAVISPFVIAAGAAAVAGAGYVLWRNRAKIQKFVQDQDLGETFDHVSDIVSDGASKVTGFLNHEVKPMTNAVRPAMDKVVDKVQAAK
jgi:hypothetical protein